VEDAMRALDRRTLLRIAAPAVALPMVAAATPAEQARQVTREEINEAFKFIDFMELRAEDLNLRYQILIDMLFETNPENLRSKLQQLADNRKDRLVLVDVNTGQTAPYQPDMQVEPAVPQPELPKPLLRTRVALWLLGWRA
jgi:hypothetical protein